MSLSYIPFLFVLILTLSILNNRPRILAARHSLDPNLDPEATRRYSESLRTAVIVFVILALPFLLLRWLASDFVSLPLAWLFIWTAAWLYVTEFRLAPKYLRRLWAATHPEGDVPTFIHSKWKWGTPVFLIVFTAVTSIMFYFEFSPIRITSEGDTVKIEAPFYKTGFELADIEYLGTLDYLPKRTKKNGFSSDRATYGYFQIAGTGPSELFARHCARPYIVVTLKGNRKVLFTGNTAEETSYWFAHLDTYWRAHMK